MMKKTFLFLSICLNLAGLGINARADELYKTGAGDFLKFDGSHDELLLSRDSGASWQSIYKVHSIWKFSARAADKIWVGYRCGPEDACVSYSTDKGYSWVDLPYDIPYEVKSLCSAEDGLGVAISQGSGPFSHYLVSSDGGQTFSGIDQRPTYCD